MNIAIIPARGGSKRIPKKNIKLFCGKPIIAYSIEAAKRSKLFKYVVVSTDLKEIAEIALQYGADVPFVRPSRLADDFTNTGEVVVHALEWLKDHEINADNVCCIQATAPFLRERDLVKGHDLLISQGVKSVFSVTTFSFPIFRALKINEKGRLNMIWPEYLQSRSQDLPHVFHDAGQFYWAKVDAYLKSPFFYSDDALPVVIPRYLVHDIDTFEDWLTAEKVFEACRQDK